MGWDHKGRGGPYYYRSVREGDRVRKVYVGKGEAAEEHARQVADRRQQRQADREVREAELAQVAEAEQCLHDLHVNAGQMLQAVMLSMGYHNHKGQWRRRR